jgi:hypothetical protein
MATVNPPVTPPTEKLCVACREPIPADATVCFHCQTRQVPEKQSGSNRLLAWIGVVTAVIGLITGLSEVVGPVKGWWSAGREAKSMLAAGQRQADLGEYEASFNTFSDLLKSSPGNVAASRARLDVAMLWLENFEVSGKDDNEIAQKAGAILDRISPVLAGGLSNDQGYRAADIVAHVGWLNWLEVTDTQQVEYEDKVEPNFQRALAMDPDNVYGNAMLGDWLLENNRGLGEAKKYFAKALATGKARAFIRDCQLGALIHNDAPGARGELIRVANDMRKNNEPISDGRRGRVHSYFDAGIGSEEELHEVLTAVPPDQAWETYRWIDRPLTEWAPFAQVQQKFIQASLWEIAGKHDDARQLFLQLQQETKSQHGTLATRIRDAVKRLSH